MNKQPTQSNLACFATGAVRNTEMANTTRYDLLLSNDVAVRRIAETFAEGFHKYGPTNWKKGFPVSELFAHFFTHIIQWISGDKSEDHLAHACWNLMAIMWQEENKPELQDFPVVDSINPHTWGPHGGKPSASEVVDSVTPRDLACPLFEGTPKQGEEFHQSLVYTPSSGERGGRCLYCNAPRHRHYQGIEAMNKALDKSNQF